MAQNKKPRKKHQRKDPGKIKMKFLPWKVASVFDPVMKVIDQLEQDGYVYVAKNGEPVYQEQKDGKWYQIYEAFEGLIKAYETTNENKTVI